MGQPLLLKKLSSRQMQALEVLLREPRIDLAAKLAGVARITLWRWLQQPAFNQAYRDARTRQLEQTITLLQSYGLESVDVLWSVIVARDTPPGVKVAAIRTMLEFTLKGREVLEIEDRLRALEQAAGSNYELRGQAKQA